MGLVQSGRTTRTPPWTTWLQTVSRASRGRKTFMTSPSRAPFRPIGMSASRRVILQRLGSASAVAATVVMAPTLVRAQEATPASDLEANKPLARQYHDEIFEQCNLDVADQ